MSGLRLLARPLPALRSLAPSSLRTAAALSSRPGPGGLVAAASRRCLSTEAASSSDETSPKVAALVDQIASLSLLEAAELTEALKVRVRAPFIARATEASSLRLGVS